MKFHEAIDMILEGGEAYERGSPNWRYYFVDGICEWLMQKSKEKLLTGGHEERTGRFVKRMLISNDWMVEKNGIIYEHYTTFKHGLPCASAGDSMMVTKEGVKIVK